MVWYTLVLESCFSSAQTLETTGFRLSHTGISRRCLTPLSCSVFVGLCRLHLSGTNEELQLSFLT